MRSVVVVLPASTWAMMPMLRISERAVVRGMATFPFRVVHAAQQPVRRTGAAHVSKMICAESSALLDPMLLLAHPGIEGRRGGDAIEIASEVQSCRAGPRPAVSALYKSGAYGERRSASSFASAWGGASAAPGGLSSSSPFGPQVQYKPR